MGGKRWEDIYAGTQGKYSFPSTSVKHSAGIPNQKVEMKGMEFKEVNVLFTDKGMLYKMLYINKEELP